MANRACPSCRSVGRDSKGDHLYLMKGGDAWHCTRCNYTEGLDGRTLKVSDYDYGTKKTGGSEEMISLEDIERLPSPREVHRGVDVDIMKNAGVKASYSTSNGELEFMYFPVRSSDGGLVGYKKRGFPKTFSTIGSFKGIPKQLFGQYQLQEAGKLLIIVEGEMDTLAARQMLADSGKNYNVVGLPFGANSAAQAIADNISFVEAFESVVLALDQDTPGRKATDEAAAVISPGKVRVATFSEKDACDLLKEGKSKEFLNAIWKAKTFQSKGIVNPIDMIDDWMSKPPRVSFSLAPCFADLEAATKGTGEGEVWIWTGGTGGGKSQIQDQNIVHWATSGIRVGFIKMEHTDSVNIQALLSVYLQANLKMDEVRSQFSPEELRKAYVDLFGSNMIYMIDHSHEDGSDSSLIDRIRQLAVGYKCKVIVIDHLNAILYEDSDSEGDENRRTDRLLRTLAKLAAQYAVSIHVVAHPRKGTSGSKSAENGGSISLDDLKGSSGVKQIPDTIVAIQRDTTSTDPAIRLQAKIVLLKNRWVGDTGDKGAVMFNPTTVNYTKVIEEESMY